MGTCGGSSRGLEQIVDIVPVVQLLHVPVRQPVDSVVEVPTIISVASLLLQRLLELAIPLPGGGGRNAGLQGILPGQSSTSTYSSEERISGRIVEQNVLPSSEERISERIVEENVFPSSEERISDRIVEQIVLPPSEERISERIVEQIVDIPGGGLQDFRPGQSSTSSSHIPAQVVDVPARGAETFHVPPDSELAVHVTPSG